MPPKGSDRLDLNQCADDCAPEQFLEDFNTYTVRWSPDGQQALQGVRYLDGNNNERQIVWLTDGRLDNGDPLVEGYQPFWLDNDQFGVFVGQELRLASLSAPDQIDSLTIVMQRPNSPINSSPLPLEVLALAPKSRRSK